MAQTMVQHTITGTLNSLNPFVWRPDAAPVAGDIDIDNDGLMPTTRAVFDIGSAVAQVIGKQTTQFAKYRVNYLQIELVNRDDASDNDDGAAFGGTLEFFKPNKHNVDALQALRLIDREYRKESLASDSPFFSPGGSSNQYTTPRMNWFLVDQNVLPRVAPMPVWQAAGLGDFPAMVPLLAVWNDNLAANAGDYANEIWYSRTGLTQKLGWNASYINNIDGTDYAPESRPFIWQAQPGQELEVLGGLMSMTIDHSSTDAPGSVDDDYTVRVTMGISGWEAI